MRTKFFDHPANEFAMMPLFIFDLSNARAFVRIYNGMPVAAIGISRSSLG